MTNGEKIRQMTDEELADWLDRMFNEAREDWEPVGCYNCINYGTHHANPSDESYACGDCEYKNGLLAWLQQEAE